MRHPVSFEDKSLDMSVFVDSIVFVLFSEFVMPGIITFFGDVSRDNFPIIRQGVAVCV